MQISEAQAAVAERYGGDRVDFLDALGWLVDALLKSTGDEPWCGKFPSYIDGVLFDHQTAKGGHVVGHGVAVIGPKQYIEPILIEFSLDTHSMEMHRATILFGMIDSIKPAYGSPLAKKIRHSMLAKGLSAKAKIEFDWSVGFQLVDGRWSCERLG